jgi:hypothetical protein
MVVRVTSGRARSSSWEENVDSRVAQPHAGMQKTCQNGTARAALKHAGARANDLWNARRSITGLSTTYEV